MPDRFRKSGQSILESSIAIMLIAFILLAVMQVGKLYVAKEFIDYSASAGTRARAVGFNDFMVYKVTKVAAIPNVGAMTTPDVDPVPYTDWYGVNVGQAVDSVWLPGRNGAPRPPPLDPRRDAERLRIPDYLATTQWGHMQAMLDYENWESVRITRLGAIGSGDAGVTISQDYPVLFPFVGAFYGANEVELESRAALPPYAEVYLQ